MFSASGWSLSRDCVPAVRITFTPDWSQLRSVSSARRSVHVHTQHEHAFSLIWIMYLDRDCIQ